MLRTPQQQNRTIRYRIYNSIHVLHPILPQKSVQPYNLRERRHSYSLLEKTSELNERDYITRILYKNCYSFYLFSFYSLIVIHVAFCQLVSYTNIWWYVLRKHVQMTSSRLLFFYIFGKYVLILIISGSTQETSYKWRWCGCGHVNVSALCSHVIGPYTHPYWSMAAYMLDLKQTRTRKSCTGQSPVRSIGLCT